MLEATPGASCSNKVKGADPLAVEGNMRHRFDKPPSWRQFFLILAPKTFARTETPEEERNPIYHHLPSPPRGSRKISAGASSFPTTI